MIYCHDSRRGHIVSIKQGDISITFQLRARHKTAEHLRKNKPKALNKSLTSRLDKKGRQRLPRMTERNKASARLFKREKKIKGRQRLLRMIQQK